MYTPYSNFHWKSVTIPHNMPFQRKSHLQNYHQSLKVMPTESGAHWCETCDRSFPTLHLLGNHKLQHQKCNIDGCQFVAHPKVVTKHIQMQHSTGLYKKIAKLEDPEEIKKWREERKKKYPTKENIEKKASEIREKIERGEKMGLKRDKHFKNKRTGVGEKRKQLFSQQSSQVFKKKKTPFLKKATQVNEKRKLKPFTGITNLMMDESKDVKTEQSQCDFLIEDDDSDQNQIDDCPKTKEPSVCSALSSLISNYASSEEEQDADEKLQSVKLLDNHDSLQIQTKQIIKENDKIYNKSDNDSGPEETTIMKKPVDNTEEPIENHKGKSRMKMIQEENKGKKSIIKKHKPKLPSTLLEKLLHREMQQERNMVLQCVRYIVKNNYFDT